MILYAPLYNFRAAKIEIVAEHLQIKLEFNHIDYSQFKTPSYLTKHPLGKIPLLQTPEGPIYESNAIIRYLARKQGSLYGKNCFERAQIDQWLDFLNHQIDPCTYKLLDMIAGWVTTDRELYHMAKEGLLKAVEVLELSLQSSVYLVGEDISIADIAIASILTIVFRLLFDQATRNRFPRVTEWYQLVYSLPAFTGRMGKMWLCEKEYDYHLREEQQQTPKEIQQVQGVTANPGANEKEKLQAKKNKLPNKQKQKSNEIEPDEEDDLPFTKRVNPLDLLPPSTFNLEQFKREFTNSQNRQQLMKSFWAKYDPVGWSIWKVSYQKYEGNNLLTSGQGTVPYITQGQLHGFMRNLDHFRKYSFAVIGVYLKDELYEIIGVWLWRGIDIPEQWLDHMSFEYHNFQKLNHIYKAHRQLVEEYWTRTTKEQLVEGLPVYQAKIFK